METKKRGSVWNWACRRFLKRMRETTEKVIADSLSEHRKSVQQQYGDFLSLSRNFFFAFLFSFFFNPLMLINFYVCSFFGSEQFAVRFLRFFFLIFILLLRRVTLHPFLINFCVFFPGWQRFLNFYSNVLAACFRRPLFFLPSLFVGFLLFSFFF